MFYLNYIRTYFEYWAEDVCSAGSMGIASIMSGKHRTALSAANLLYSMLAKS
jgi:hypothetical protein